MLHLKSILWLCAQLFVIVYSRSIERSVLRTSRKALAGVVALAGTVAASAVASGNESPALPASQAHDEVLALLGVEPTPIIEIELEDIEVLSVSNVYDWLEAAPDPFATAANRLRDRRSFRTT